MEIETITKLLDAGYTKAEIDAMQAGHDKGSETDKGAGAPDQNAGEVEGAANEENASKIAQPVEFAAAIEALTNTVAGLKETVKVLQEKNAAAASIDKPNKDTIKETIDSFMQNF